MASGNFVRSLRGEDGEKVTAGAAGELISEPFSKVRYKK